MSWTIEEKNILKKYYGKIRRSDLMEKLFKKKKSAMQQMAKTLGLKSIRLFNRLWTKNELSILKKFFPYLTKEKIMKKLPNRALHTIISKAYSIGLYKTILLCKPWTRKEDKILIPLYYKSSWKMILKSLPDRSMAAIRHHARVILKLQRPHKRSDVWLERELALLKKIIPNNTKVNIIKYFPNRSYRAILNRACKLKLKKRWEFGNRSEKLWTKEEDLLMRENYPYKTWKELSKLFPLRTKSAICGRAKKLFLHRKIVEGRWTEEENKILLERYPTEGPNALVSVLNRPKNQIQKIAQYRGIKTIYDHSRCGATTDLTPLLEESNIAYYWIGYLSADGSFNDNHVTLTAAIKDKNQLKKYAKLVNSNVIHIKSAAYPTYAVKVDHKQVIGKIKEKFGFVPRKTYHPPFSHISNDDKLFMSYMIGFLDGDGYIEWNQGGHGWHCSVHVHCHMSWKKWLTITFKRMLRIIGVDYNVKVRPAWNKIRKVFYIDVSINSKEFIRKLKLYILKLNIPYLERKWNKINISDIGVNEQSKNISEIIKVLLYKKKTIKEIAKIVKRTTNGVYWNIRHHKLII